MPLPIEAVRVRVGGRVDVDEDQIGHSLHVLVERIDEESANRARPPQWIFRVELAFLIEDSFAPSALRSTVLWPQKRPVDKLALAILDGRFAEGDAVRVHAADGHLVFEKVAAAAPVA